MMNTIAYFGHHKCASTYIAAVVRNVAHLLGLTTHTEFLSSRLPLGYEKRPEYVIRIADAYHEFTVKRYDCICHGNADMAVVAAVTQHGPFRGFHVIRDPRDIIVSGYFWHLSERALRGAVTYQWNQERRERLLSASTKEEGLLIELELATSHFTTMGEWDYQQSNICEMKYEDMILDPLTFFVTAFTFVGLPVVNYGGVSTCGVLVNRLALSALRRPAIKMNVLPRQILQHLLNKLSFERQADGRRPGQEITGHKYRKGLAGDWRNHFTPRVTDAFKERYGTLLLKLGYEDNWDW